MVDERDLPPPATRTEGEGETLDMPEGYEPFTSGQVLGERYQILEMLGRGGMGEVWHTFDLKLRVEVALKALRDDFFKSERRLEMLRDEVRAAREVVSPNVCRIFDLIEIESRELVSMEYVDGATLLGVLQERGPLDLKEAQDIASQFLAGLEAIHKVGLIHRDIKPENIMLTRAGRVVVMDFGLARQDSEGGGSVSGTPAYMAPEQAAGQTVDARADVYAAGVVLAEMVSPDGIKSYESRQSVWEGIRSEPAKLPDSPWAPVLKRAVAKDREGRYNTARTLTRALEDVTLRVEGADDLHPYPGLASYTEADAEYFFGREAEVEQMWRKLEGPARILALVGPSGAGKTSFLRAGVIPSAATQWAIVRCTPGTTALASLRQALVPVLGGDTEALGKLAGGGDEATISACSRWRALHGKALLIVDQFEELFTLNSFDAQRRYAELLNQLPLASDVHVMVSMRDDFLMECNRFEALRPVVSDLTLVDRPTGANLRRALVQPSTKCGYRFEDDELVEEMLAEVEGERGALPLLAFAAARLWDKRDRETGLLTREAYHDIGGVGGALARHAETTLENIGVERLPIVRELFRNLVTADGTRAIREWGELLSVFSDSQRDSPEKVLRDLIDARLLTSYEVREDEREPTRRVEIIHESLLANWPRLVRWQTQDADAAQLRDQLRQAARTWDEQGRADDTLWTGSAYREYTFWRERYPGGLTEIEEAFATAMISLATRRRRRRRMAAAAALVLAITVASVFGVLWRRSVMETRRAEAAKLLALAEVQLDADPTEALAFATASLQLADIEEARTFVMKALWAAPPSLVLNRAENSGTFPRFSPDGRWLAAAGHAENVLVYGQDGKPPMRLSGHTIGPGTNRVIWASSNLFVTGHGDDPGVRVWSMPEGRLIRTIDFGQPGWWHVGKTYLFVEVGQCVPGREPGRCRLLRWKLPDGEAEDLGSVDFGVLGVTNSVFDPRGRGWIYVKENTIYHRPLPIRDGINDLVIGRNQNEVVVQPPRLDEPDRIWSRDRSTGEMKCWSLSNPSLEPMEIVQPPSEEMNRRFAVRDHSGEWRLPLASRANKSPWLWDRSLLPGARPLRLRANTSWYFSYMDIDATRRWLVASAEQWDRLVFWPLVKTYPSVVEGYDHLWKPVGFSPDGNWLVTAWADDSIRFWSLSSEARQQPPTPTQRFDLFRPIFDITGKRLLTTGFGHTLFIVPMGEGSVKRLEGFSEDHIITAAAFSPSGRLVAAGTSYGTAEPKALRVWDLETRDVQVFDLERAVNAAEEKTGPQVVKTGYEDGINTVYFESESVLYTSGRGGVRKWDLETGTASNFGPTGPGLVSGIHMAADRARLLVITVFNDKPTGQLKTLSAKPVVEVHDLETGTSRPLDGLPPLTGRIAFDPAGEIYVVGNQDGSIWVGRIEGGKPHLLVGHEGKISRVAISPNLQWIASSGEDETLRLWPMPDLSKPPLHTLPHDKLIAKLHSLTNIRVVRDEESSTGWKVEVGPFPGWAEVPEW